VVVTKQCGIAPLLAGRAALLVAHDADAIAGAIRRVLSEPELHDRLAAGGREAVSHLGWEEPARQMEELYGRLVAAQSRVA
jgi:glycosyltransferase involved in cell wall biosynthesis